jgi:glycosyltransferase involved in cell wall biosynthesis
MNTATNNETTSMDTGIDYSIIIPVYCNYGSLISTFQKLQEEVIKRNSSRTYEIIFIDDGSHDDSFLELMEIKGKDSDHVKVIKFTRNFGQISAIRAGMQHAKGKCIINISADLQDPPELINQMLDAHFNEGHQLVICTRNMRDESFFRRTTSRIFYSLIKKISFPGMPSGGFDFFLIGSKANNLIKKSREQNPFLQGQILWTGFEAKMIPYERKKREIGKSKWTLAKKLKYLIDGVMAYSYLPLRFMTVLGIIISGLGLIYSIVIFFAKIFGGIKIEGWAPTMIVILILSGFQMLMLGIIGEYLWRTLDQVRNRDPFVVEEFYD